MNRSELDIALRVLRSASGKEAKAVARSAVMSPSKLSRIETGKIAPSADDVNRILTAIGVSDDVKAEYMGAARAVATEATAWRLIQRAGLHKAQQRLRDAEAQMSLLRVFQPALVPGLLQTPEYMRAILSRYDDLSEETVRRTASARIERQEALYDASKTLQFVITEPVLRWLIVPARVMAGQLDRLVSASRLPSVEIRVVPIEGRKYDIPNHAFVIQDDRVVAVETVHAEVVVTDPRDVSLYVSKFDGFSETAVSGDAMRALIEGIRDELLREQETD
ncbi:MULTISPECIES: helix-turn-helix transcriptional regulator [unclassified Streptomyces]|uniref:helix-turn-helix domain-containing protein n=1 Tax=unclassified Streptomyces TaxID=2593676 RepID=UPI000978F1BF|nr:MULTISPECIES: helix-turn-helix transcriptional regulator [unclassified Streptomyces]ONI54978.1 Helix-turn-helix domain protein [Streptomyces sp. IB2014 011-1]RDV52802.1 XRE family transcriptional regulator [Streptomyces sp. IB2014 011-12]